MLLEWKNSLGTGVTEIDIQHQELFNRINRLFDSFRKKEAKEEVGKVLRFLDDYIVGHFMMEEMQMTSNNYPGYSYHKEQHDKFTEEFSDLKRWFDSHDEDVVAAASTTRLLRDWWINHITTVDMELGRFLKEGKK